MSVGSLFNFSRRAFSGGVSEMEHGGIVFRARGQLSFLPASIAVKVMPAPAIARVPGGPAALRGVALVDGDMIAIIEAGDATSKAILVCALLGEHVGLIGVDIVATGRFPAVDGGDVRHESEIARAFDIASLIAKVRRGRWGATLEE